MRKLPALLSAVIAASIAMGVGVAESAAAPGPKYNGTIYQGLQINANHGARCTLTVIDKSTAYSALHCGHGEWKVGTQVTALPSNKPVGEIVALGSDLPKGKELDVLKIKLYPATGFRPVTGVGDSSKLKNGDPVSIVAPGNRNTGVVTDARIRRIPVGKGEYPSDLITTNVQAFNGNSGGPLLTKENKIVGVLSGGNQKDISVYTPIHIVQERLG